MDRAGAKYWDAAWSQMELASALDDRGRNGHVVRRYQELFDCHLVAAPPGDGADLSDAVAVDCNVSLAWRGARAVDDNAPPDHQIVISHGRSPGLDLNQARTTPATARNMKNGNVSSR